MKILGLDPNTPIAKAIALLHATGPLPSSPLPPVEVLDAATFEGVSILGLDEDDTCHTRAPGPEGFRCTLAKGHACPHLAQDPTGFPIVAWKLTRPRPVWIHRPFPFRPF